MRAKYQKETGAPGVVVESHGEYHLPDYAGDMRKILCASARVVPAGKFVGGADIQFGGTVQYDFWYLDGENKLTHESFSTDYEFTCPHGGTGDGNAAVSVAHFSLRPSGPRRITAKATLQAKVHVREEAEYALENAPDEALLHTAQKSVLTGRMLFSKPYEREYAESIAIPAAYAEGAEVSYSEGVVQIEEVQTEQDAVLVRGSYAVSAILMGEGLAPLRVSEAFEFNERIPAQDCTADMEATADGFFTSLTATLKQEAEGEPSLRFHGICEFSCAAEKNEEIFVVEDAFLEGGGATVEAEPLVYDHFGFAKTMLRTVELSLPLCEGEGAMPHGIFHTSVLLKNEAKEVIEGELRYSAEAEICALSYTCGEEGEMHYAAHKQTAPFSLSLPLNQALLPDGKISVDASVGFCEGRVDDGAIAVRFLLMMRVSNRAQREISCVRRVLSEPKSENLAPCYAVYYPAPGDTLWSVAKKYGVSPASIATANRIAAPASGELHALPEMLLIDCRK